jgi:hypothetical protein
MKDGRQVKPEAGAVVADFSSAECDPKTRTRRNTTPGASQDAQRRLMP